MELLRKFRGYALKKLCPHRPRVTGQEISLLTEVVLDTEVHNLFPDKAPVKQVNTVGGIF